MPKVTRFWNKKKSAAVPGPVPTADEAQIQAKSLNEGLRVLQNIKHMVHSFDARGPQAWGAANEADRYLDGLIGQTKEKLAALAEHLPVPAAPAEGDKDEKPAV